MKDHPIARPTCGDATTPGIADNAPSEIGDQERERILARWTRIAVRLLQASHAELRAGEQGVDALAPRPACTNEPANRHEALACLGIPLPAAEGVPRGQLVVYDRAGRVWTAADVAVLCEVASALADALGVIAEKRRCSSLEAKLRDQVEMYRALIEASAEIVWVTNPDGVATEPSSSWQRYTGQSAEDWLGFGWMQVVHPEDQDRLRGFWVTAAAEGRPQSIEYRLRHNSGHWRWIHERTAPLVEPTGKLKGWVGMSFDIDDRRKAEEATRKSEAHQRALVEAMSVMTWSAGADNVLMDGTADKWCEFTGQTLADWHARQWLEVVHPDDRAAVSRRWFEQATSSQSTEYEYRLWHRSGEWRWVLERTVPLLDDRQGTCAGWVGMTTDITDYKRAELSVQESESRFRALVEASSNIVWTVDADGKFLEDSPSWRGIDGSSGRSSSCTSSRTSSSRRSSAGTRTCPFPWATRSGST